MASSIVFELSRSVISKLQPAAEASITNLKALLPSSLVTSRLPCTVKKDHGRIYIAQNAARHPSSPLEPLFRALFASDPDFAINSIDIISDRNNIRKLLSFIDPSLDSKRLEPFTIKAELINGTAVLCRDETRVQIFVGPKKFVGYGHEFEKAYTTQEIHGSTGHHRIISYCLDNLNFIIRHETDGYADDALTESTRITKENNGLSEMLQDLSLSKGAEKAEHPGSKLAVRKQGRIVPQDSVLEIKTAGQNKRLPFKKAASQLWISQTNKLVRASHKEGTFDVPFVEDVSAEIAKWEENNQEHLRMLVSLIRRIIEVVKSTGDVFIKYDPEGDKLVISKRRGKKMLPRDLYLKMTGTTPRGDNVTLHAKTEEHPSENKGKKKRTNRKHNKKNQINANTGGADTTADVKKDNMPMKPDRIARKAKS